MNSFYVSLWREKISRRGFNWSFFVILSAVLIVSGFFVPNAQAISSINITNPVGGENLKGTVNITWATTGGAEGDTVDIVYSTNNFDNTVVIAVNLPFDDSSFSWDTDTPEVLDGNNYRIEVSKHGFPTIRGRTDAFTIDNTPPAITDNYVDDGVWVNSAPQTVTLSPSDENGISFVKTCEGAGCTPDISRDPPYELTYSISQDTIVRYQAWDVAGNSSTIGEFNIKLDIDDPIVDVSGKPSELIVDKNGVTAEVICEDGLSGCSETKYEVYTTDPTTCSTDLGTYTNYTDPVTITDHSWVCAYAKDDAGNEDFSDPVEFTIFDTIQSAIDAASPDDTIQVVAGTYPETLNLQGKSLIIRGAGVDSTIVDASSETGYAIQNFGNSSTISDLTLIGNDNYGFKVSHVSDITLENIKVKYSYKTAIDLNTVNNAVLSNIEIINTEWGFGLMILDSNNVTVTDVTTSGNVWGGVSVQTKNAISNNITFRGTFNASDDFPFLVEQDPDASNTYYNINTEIPSNFKYVVYDFRDGSDNYKQWYYFEILSEAKTVAQGFAADLTYSDILIYDIAENNYYVESGMKIQDAINAASEGDTISVAAGTYDEQVVINKALTLQGVGDTTIIQPPAVELTATSNIPWIGTTHTMAAIVSVETIGGSVMVKNLKIDGSLIPSKSTTWVAGLVYLETSGTIDSVKVIGNPNLPDRTAGIFASAVNNIVSVEVTGCIVEVYTRAGIYALGDKMTANYHHNVINGPGATSTGVPNGMFFLEGATGSATYNIVTDLSYTGEEYRSTGIGTYNAGINIIFSNNEISYVQNAFALSKDTIGTTVEYNDVHDCHTGIRIESGATDSIIQHNDIYNNDFAIRCGPDMGDGNVAHYNKFVDNLGPEWVNVEGSIPYSYTGVVSNVHDTYVLDATKNYWGTAYRPTIVAMVSGLVDFEPYWVNEAMDILSTKPVDIVYIDDNYSDVDADSHIFGYDAFTIIQEGIDAVAENGTVDVAAGTYNLDSPIVVDKSLTITGDITTPSNVVVNAPLTEGLYDRDCFQVLANDVTIHGFKIVGAQDWRPGDVGDWGKPGRQNAGIMVGSEATLTTQGVYRGISGGTFSYNEFVDCSKGAFLYHAKNSEISYNTFTTTEGQNPDNFYDTLGWNGDGIHVYLEVASDYPTGNIISHNTMDNVRVGIFLNGDTICKTDTNPSAWDFQGTTIEDNTITNVWNAGIILQCASGTADGETPIIIKDNDIDTSTGRRTGDEGNERGLISVKGDYTEITGNTLSNSEEHGIWVDGSHHTVTGNTVHSNTKDGIHIGWYKETEPNNSWTLPNIGRTDITINLNGIYSNTEDGLDGVQADEEIDAENNWWGAFTGPQHLTNPGGLGDVVSDNVDFSPFCTDEECTEFGSIGPMDHLRLGFNPALVTIPGASTITLTAEDSYNITLVNDNSTQVSLIADRGAAFGFNLLTLTNGVALTDVSNTVPGVVNVTVSQVGGTIADTGQVTFEGDTEQPTIISHVPADDTIDVSVSTAPYLVFSEPLKSTTVNSTNIQLKKYSDDSAVAAIVSLVEGGTQVNIAPNSSLENDTRYYFAVSISVQDEAGNPLAVTLDASTNDSHEFTTVGIEPFSVDDIEAKSSTAEPNNTYVDGWHYTYYLTINATDETELFVQFADWLNTDDDPVHTIPANGNMRVLFNNTTGGGLGNIVGNLTEDYIVNGFGSVDSYEIGNNFTDQKLGGVESEIDTGILDTGSASGRQVRFDVFTKIPADTVTGVYESDYTLQLGN